MLAIRMQRKGREHDPMYRIIVQESQRHPLSGRIVAEVGNYNPATKQLYLNKVLVQKYLDNGAQPSSRVAYILKKSKVELPKWYQAATAQHAKAKHADKLRKNQPKEEAAAPEVSAEASAPAETSQSTTETSAPEVAAETAETSESATPAEDA